jgi:hypothetical protein
MCLPRDGDPDLDRVPASSARLHPRSPPRRQERERCADPIAGPVASEQIADRGSGHALGSSVLERARNFVGNRVAQEVAKDECGG